DPLLLVSIGGGRVGHELIECALAAEAQLPMPHRLHILTGPHIPTEQFQSLQELAADRPHVTLQRHTTQFLDCSSEATFQSAWRVTTPAWIFCRRACGR